MASEGPQQDLADGDAGVPGAPDMMVWERPVTDQGPTIRLPKGQAAYRQHQALVGLALFPLVLFVVPIAMLFAIAVIWNVADSGHLAQRAGPVAGLVVSIGIVSYAINWIGLLGNRRFGRKLRAIVGERTGREGGELVSIATHETVSFYERHLIGHGDVGLLYEDGDGLVFEGLRKRLVVPRTDVLEVSESRNWQFVQFGARWCVVRYRTRDGEREGRAELRIHSRRERTIRRNVTATRALRQRIASWWAMQEPA